MNLRIELPSNAPVVLVRHYAPHPCGGYYAVEASVYGPLGLLGRLIPPGPAPASAPRQAPAPTTAGAPPWRWA